MKYIFGFATVLALFIFAYNTVDEPEVKEKGVVAKTPLKNHIIVVNGDTLNKKDKVLNLSDNTKESTFIKVEKTDLGRKVSKTIGKSSFGTIYKRDSQLYHAKLMQKKYQSLQKRKMAQAKYMQSKSHYAFMQKNLSKQNPNLLRHTFEYSKSKQMRAYVAQLDFQQYKQRAIQRAKKYQEKVHNRGGE